LYFLNQYEDGALLCQAQNGILPFSLVYLLLF